jgi:hypothetical protein
MSNLIPPCNTSCLKDGRIKTYPTSKSLNTKKRQYMALEIQIIVWDRHKNELRTPWPIHFKLRIVIGIDSLMVCILCGEILIFHSRVMGKKILYQCWRRAYHALLAQLFIYVCWNFTKKYTDHKTINSNNYAKFEVNWPRGSQFTAWHTKTRLQFDE